MSSVPCPSMDHDPQQQQQPQFQMQYNNQQHQQQLHQQQQHTPESNGPRAKCDQVIFEAISKAAEIIVNGRTGQGGGGIGATLGGQPLFHQPSQPSLYGGGNGNNFVNTSSAGASSSRFNLMVPEIAGVRRILQRWRRALHVPLRLDLYYQQNGQDAQQNILLERWCLEYRPTSHDPFYEKECKSSDPIVQLRHVCKKIVIWLRNLYSSSRLLPAQAFQHASCGAGIMQIGVSIYILSNSTDDVTDLVEKQGFSCQAQPSTVLTPYGELEWKVYHSSKADIEPLLPPHHPFKSPLWMPRERTTAPMAIPRNTSVSAIDQMQQQQQQQKSQPIGVPQSAPTGIGGQYFMQGRNNGMEQDQHPAHQQPRNTYHAPRHMMHHRSNSLTNDPNNPHAHAHPHTIMRRNTSIGIEEAKTKTNVNQEDLEHPERLLSGLSLAMMSTDNNDNLQNDTVEKRRAALHHAPPHLMEQDTKRNQPTTAGEYGYAYNNHISWNQIRPSTTVPIALPGKDDSARQLSYSPSAKGGRLGSSPSPLAGTPPGAVFLRPASVGKNAALHGTSPLIPPRAAPPFPNRPIGFCNEPAAPSMLHQQLAAPPAAASEQQPELSSHTNMAPPMTSLDLLHSSPFQQGASVLSTLSAGVGPTGSHAMNNLSQASLLRPSLASSAIVPARGAEEDEGPEYDMPFAVEMDLAPPSATTTEAPSIATAESLLNLGASSSAVASFAQKCAPAQHRLKLFDSHHVLSGGGANDCTAASAAASDLTNQLAEFRNFGASLSLPSATKGGSSGGGSDEGSSATMTPLPLRTS